MDNASSTHSILDTLRTVEFRLGLKGYNVDEVDEYLEKAAIEAEQVQERLRSANERLRQATERIAQLEVEVQRLPAERTAALQPAASAGGSGQAEQGGAVSDDTLQRTFLLAQKFVEQTKRESEAEAAQVVSQAEERARTLLAQAEERARQVASETEERLRDEVSRLEQARSRLGSDVDSMSRYLEEQRTKVRASLVDALRWIDERLQAPSGSSGERGGDGAAAQPAERTPPGEGATSGAGAAPAGAGGTVRSGGQSGGGAGSPAGAGAGRAQVASPPPSAPQRQPAATPPPPSSSAPAPGRAQAPVGARVGVLNGGLFEAGGDEANGVEGDRPGD